jgi:hypothetical protein
VLYLLSCLAEFKDMRAELEAADAVPMLLDLLSTCADTKIQACPAPALDCISLVSGSGCRVACLNLKKGWKFLPVVWLRVCDRPNAWWKEWRQVSSVADGLRMPWYTER